MPLRSIRHVRAQTAVLAMVAAAALLTACAPAAAPHRTTEAVSSGAVARGRVRVPRSGRPATLRAGTSDLSPVVRSMRRDEVRRVLQMGEPGTYVGELLLGRDSALTRWPDRVERPLIVWIATADGRANWQDEHARQVRTAFEAWQRTGIPVRFAFVADSARADIHVGWVDRFAEPISGKTVWTRDDAWWIVDANITLALHHRDGAPLDTAQVRAIALHEIGHLIGLDHTTDATNIMAPKVRVRELSLADQSTARLLYSVPAGRIK
ncbi:MAG TPA: matrixin family metalloprotease [Gemmatirosa sp.]|nr:matrixin family metalloprotease [Gemmatirosa sp.]